MIDATDTVDVAYPSANITDIWIDFEIVQRVAGRNDYVLAEFEILSGTAVLRVNRSHDRYSASTPSSAIAEVSAPARLFTDYTETVYLGFSPGFGTAYIDNIIVETGEISLSVDDAEFY